MNRKNKWIIGVLCLVGIFSFCYIRWNHDLTPAETITKFHEATKKGNVGEVKNYLSEQQVELIPYIISKQNKAYKKVSPLKDTQKINGDMAEIEVKVFWTDNRESTKKHFLIKENSVWKIYSIKDLF